MTTYFNDSWETPERTRTPLPSLESHRDENGMHPDWTPGGRRQRGVVDEYDQGDYSTLLEHVLPNRPSYTPTAPYSSVLRSARRATETMEYRPERDGGMVRENMPDRQQRGLTEKDYIQYQQNLSNAVASGRMPMERAVGLLTRAQQAMQPRMGQGLGETAQSVTGQTHSIIDGLLQQGYPQSNRGYAGAPANRPVLGERPIEQTPPPYGTPSRLPRTAQEAYQQAQQRQAQLSERGQAALADLRTRISERQAKSQAALASLRQRLSPSSAGGNVMSSTENFQIDRSSPQAFLGSFRPAAEAALEQAGLPTSLAPILAAIPMNEQGWQNEAPGNNYYGIKGKNTKTGASQTSATWEDYGNGRVNIKDEFRAYSNPAESVSDFIQFLKDNPRYGNALEIAKSTGDPEQFIRAVHAAGYATDPKWADKVLNIASTVPPSVQVSRGVTVQQQQKAVKSGTSVWEIGKLTPNQLTEGMAQGLDRETALAVCGPAAAIAFARKMGRNPSLPEAVDMAKKVGWTLENGMAGPASQVKLLQNMGIPAMMEEGFPDSAKMASTVSAGNPVTISTPGHYFVAEEYDPKSGKFNWGESARVLKASGGNSWYSLDEIKNLGMGTPRAAIYMQDQ